MNCKQTSVSGRGHSIRLALLLAASAVGLLGTGVRADNALAPGQTKSPLAGVALAQQPDLAGGQILSDVTRFFDVTGQIFSVTDRLKGNVRMVVRKADSGRMVFEYIITSDPASTGNIICAQVSGDTFKYWPLDVAYRADAPGQVAPTSAWRADAGADILFDFRDFRYISISPGETSKKFFIALKNSHVVIPPPQVGRDVHGDNDF